MTRRKHSLYIFFFALLGLMLVVTSLPTTPALAAEAAAYPAQAQPGTRVTFIGSGYQPGERVDPWVTYPNNDTVPRYPTVNADADGGAIWTWDVPADAPEGTYYLVGRGIESRNRPGGSFEVVRNAPPPLPYTATPETGGPGSVFTFTASGFQAFEQVGVWLAQPDGTNRDLVPGEIPDYVADENGQVTWQWTATSDIPSGVWRANAQGLLTGYTVSVPFTINAGIVITPNRTVAPQSGPPGTTFTFTLGGFAPDEQIGTWLNQPDGSRRDATPYLFADATGLVTWQWTSPTDAPAGVWQGVTQGFSSREQAVLNFTVTGDNQPPVTPTYGSNVTPTSGVAGTEFTFSAAGFQPEEDIFYWAVDPTGVAEIESRRIATDREGQATWTWTAPEFATPGQWIMTARGEFTRFEVQIPLTINAQPDQLPLTGVVPNVGQPDTTFSFLARGFNDSEELNTWVNGPNGAQYRGVQDLSADPTGIAEWQWIAPSDVPSGAYAAVIEGPDSRVVYQIDFTINRDEPLVIEQPYSVSPERGAPGTTFVFTASGFKPEELAGYWFNRPDGSIVRVDIEKGADSKGIVRIVWTAPADAQPGQWRMVLKSSQSDGINNDVQYLIPFVIQ